MSNPTTYYTVGGVDLSNIFQPLSLGTAYSSATGYKIPQPDGRDLTEIFAAKTYGWIKQINSSSRPWQAITSSSDGTQLAAVVGGGGINITGYIYISTDSGTTWKQYSSLKSWKAITSSSDGTYLAAVPYSGSSSNVYEYIYTSSDSGLTWITQTDASSNGWFSIASSSDGSKIFACVGIGGYVWMSMDYGYTWTELKNIDFNTWSSITCSSDGTKIAVAASNTLNGYIYTAVASYITFSETNSVSSSQFSKIVSSGDGNTVYAAECNNLTTLNSVGVYRSTNSGNSWSDLNYYVRRSDLASSKNGVYVVSVNQNYSIQVSSDSGATWVSASVQNPSNLYINVPFTCVASSATGQYMIAVTASRTFLVSTDYGSNFILKYNIGASSGSAKTALSSDGSVGYVAVYSGKIYVSKNYGSNWYVPLASPSGNWSSIITWGNGQFVAATKDGEYIYISSDYGESWTAKTGPGMKNWSCITSSDDGKYLAASVNGGYIYTSSNYGNFWVEQTGAGSKSWVSITSSSDGNILFALATNQKVWKATNVKGTITWTKQTNSSTGNKSWNSISSSDDFTILAACAGSYTQISVSTDLGVTWTNQGTPGNNIWRSISVSKDGKNIFAISDNDTNIWKGTITNGVISWSSETVTTDSTFLRSITSSSDGLKVAISSSNNNYIQNGVWTNNGGYIYTSNNTNTYIGFKVNDTDLSNIFQFK
jgi:hypothetical protein